MVHGRGTLSVDYDYIIIGAGSAGCVLANRLSADARNRVLLIEAGRPNTHLYVNMPTGYGKAVGDPRFDWIFSSGPEPELGGRMINTARGKVIGGSSSINAMAYVRGHAADFDHWRQLGNVGWGWDDVRRTYQRIEDYDEAKGEDRFRGGMMPVRRAHSIHPMSYKLIEASVQAGLPATDDYNLPDPDGLAVAQINAADGLRASAAASYLAPARGRKNLKVITDAEARRILFTGKRATGVEFERHGRIETVKARGEVIISASSINSPKLLELSGVGQGERLRQLGVEVLCDLPGVGENLQDHYFVGARLTLKGVNSLNQEMRLPRLALHAAQYGILRSGLLASTLSQVMGYAKVLPGSASGDIQFIGSPTTMRAKSRGTSKEMRVELEETPGVGLGCYVCRPESRGRSHAISPDPKVYSSIVNNYLSTDYDRRVLIEGVRLCRRILEQPAFDGIRAGPPLPAPEVQTDEQMLDYLRMAGGSAQHQVGTCKMGSDPMAVVDDRLRVRGVEGLRVIDSSIMPTVVSANTHASTVVIAERGSEFVLDKALA